jgi:hypothetical protein
MALDPATLPKDVASLTALFLHENAARLAAEARSADLDAEISHLKLTIAKMKRAEYGPSSEKTARLIDQLEMQLGELVATASEGKASAAIEYLEPVAEEEPQNQLAGHLTRHSRANGSCMKRRALAPIAARIACTSSERVSRKRSNMSPHGGKFCSMCARSSPVGTARRSRKRPHPRIPLRPRRTAAACRSTA